MFWIQQALRSFRDLVKPIHYLAERPRDPPTMRVKEALPSAPSSRVMRSNNFCLPIAGILRRSLKENGYGFQVMMPMNHVRDAG